MQIEQQFLEAIQANQGIIRKLAGIYAQHEEDKKDLYQEILLQAWKAFPKFRGDSKFSTWLYKVSLNTILTASRKKNKETYREQIDDHITDTGSSGLAMEDRQMIGMAMNQLSDIDKALISLHLDGYSNPEIADILGISLNHTGVKLHRIKQVMTKKMQAL